MENFNELKMLFTAVVERSNLLSSERMDTAWNNYLAIKAKPNKFIKIDIYNYEGGVSLSGHEGIPKEETAIGLIQNYLLAKLQGRVKKKNNGYKKVLLKTLPGLKEEHLEQIKELLNEILNIVNEILSSGKVETMGYLSKEPFRYIMSEYGYIKPFLKKNINKNYIVHTNEVDRIIEFWSVPKLLDNHNNLYDEEILEGCRTTSKQASSSNWISYLDYVIEIYLELEIGSISINWIKDILNKGKFPQENPFTTFKKLIRRTIGEFEEFETEKFEDETKIDKLLYSIDSKNMKKRAMFISTRKTDEN